MIEIVNPFAGHPVRWTWQDHRDNGYQGGTDYSYPKDTAITAAADGVVQWIPDGLNSLAIVLADGRRVNYRELKTGSRVRDGSLVKLGDRIGTSGRRVTIKVGDRVRVEIKYPHIDGSTKGGVRVPFEPMVTPTEPAGGGDITPLSEENEMQAGQVHYKKGSTIYNALYVPGTAYWFPWSSGDWTIANGFAKNLPTGSSVEVTQSVFTAMAAAAEKLLPAG